VNSDPEFAVITDLFSYHDVMVWENPEKKPTPSQATPGLEPGTS
jgi:hypothetical protein